MSTKYELFMELIRLSSKVKSNPEAYSETLKSWSKAKIEKVCIMFDIHPDYFETFVTEELYTFVFKMNTEEKVNSSSLLTLAHLEKELKIQIEFNSELLSLVSTKLQIEADRVEQLMSV